MRDELVREIKDDQNANEWVHLGLKYDAAEDHVKERVCYEEALKLRPNHQWANYDLGLMYKYGQGVNRSITKARKHFEKAAAEGHEGAKLQCLKFEMEENRWPLDDANQWCSLGIKYDRETNGRPQDRIKERLCYQEALKLKKNHPKANYNLGLMYKLSQGVDKNVKIAAAYFEIAAAQKYKKSQYELLKLEMSGNKWETCFNEITPGEEASKFAAYDEVAKLQALVSKGFSLNTRYVDFPPDSPEDVVMDVLKGPMTQPKKSLSWLGLGIAMMASSGVALLPVMGGFVTSIGLTGTFTSTMSAAEGSKVRFLSPYWKQGWTLLHFAAATDARKVALYLINKSVKFDIPNEAGKTTKVDMTEIRDAAGRTFLDIAKKSGHQLFVAWCQGAIATRGQARKEANDIQRDQMRADDIERAADQLRTDLESVSSRGERYDRMEPVGGISGDGQFLFLPEEGSEVQGRRFHDRGIRTSNSIVLMWPLRRANNGDGVEIENITERDDEGDEKKCQR